MKSIPIKRALSIPHPVLETCAKLRSAGHVAWLAGGCVRDILLKRKVRDWDIVTNTPLEIIRNLFPRHLEVGTIFGIVKLPKFDDVLIDIAIFRQEAGYSDRRHPDTVATGSPETDMARRDFTINALYLDTANNQILDGVDGIADLNKGVIRTVGDPKERLSEDALRILRAVRFSAQLGFKIEPKTYAALAECAEYLADVSRERVHEELFRMLQTPRAGQALLEILMLRLWSPVFGETVEVPRKIPPAWVRDSHERNPIFWLCTLALCGWLGPREKTAEHAAQSLRLSNTDERTVSRVLAFAHEIISGQYTNRPQAFVEEEIRHPGLFTHAIGATEAAGKIDKQQIADLSRAAKLISKWAELPAVSQNWPHATALLKQGMKPGPQVGLELKKLAWEHFWQGPFKH